MNQDKALELLRNGPDGIADWNKRRYGGGILPSLRAVDLRDLDLSEVDFSRIDLTGAHLEDSILESANFRDAFLPDVKLSRASLYRANFFRANLRGASFEMADCSCANFESARLDGANLCAASFREASLVDVSLRDGILRDAELARSAIRPTSSERADFAGATWGGTQIMGFFTGAVGLDDTYHTSPSEIAVSTILSFTELPENFLRGCGLSDSSVAFFRSQVGSPIRFYSCFISYSTADEEFATRLHNDFQAAGIRCWKWDHNAKTGQSLWGEIDQAIRLHEKVVLIASEASLKSPAVNREIERAIRQEDDRQAKQGKGEYDGDVSVLFPVRVDDYIFESWKHERKVDVTKKVIADATRWNEPAEYAKVRDRLIRDLKAEAEKESVRVTSMDIII